LSDQSAWAAQYARSQLQQLQHHFGDATSFARSIGLMPPQFAAAAASCGGGGSSSSRRSISRSSAEGRPNIQRIEAVEQTQRSTHASAQHRNVPSLGLSGHSIAAAMAAAAAEQQRWVAPYYHAGVAPPGMIDQIQVEMEIQTQMKMQLQVRMQAAAAASAAAAAEMQAVQQQVQQATAQQHAAFAIPLSHQFRHTNAAAAAAAAAALASPPSSPSL
jgi:hypothetical protein